MRKVYMVAALAAAVGAGAWAMAREQGAGPQMPVAERFSEMMDVGGAEATLEAKVATQTRRESGALNVGDADSFGRNVRWLGLMSSVPLALRPSCAPLPGDPVEQRCAEVDPASPGARMARFDNVASMTLPARSVNSLLCHWLTPTTGGSFANYSGMDDRTARMALYPRLTVVNDVFNEPGLVDPVTGEPIVGKIDIAMSSIWSTAALDSGETTMHRSSSTRTCIGGFITRQVLMQGYGLSERQAAAFFANPTTLQLGVDVVTQHVASAGVTLSVRWVGD